MNEQGMLDLIALLQHERVALAIKLAVRTTELADVELDRESLRSMLKAQNTALKAVRESLDVHEEAPDGDLWSECDVILRGVGL